ncbi:MAG: Gfo/Idh/MocA family oxidoreductase [Lentisphaeria bacterium]|nr:Gfo/Idh/MocA family oxidoreductase [Lentisphaeria bacterium]
MSIRFAFAGFRHGHIFALVNAVKERSGLSLVACCEEDETTRQELRASGRVEVTHDDYAAMLREVDCDVVAIGDYYARRGAMALAALRAGRHVILDKPVCTAMDELDAIARESRERGLRVGCQLDMRHNPKLVTMRRLIREGLIGEPRTVCVTGQHPLNFTTRPKWYFTPGCHGGTITDIGIHAIDLLPWLTGRGLAEVTAARAWNAKAAAAPCFKDCAQFMLRMENGGGVLGDVSYLSPDHCGYGVRQYWRLTVHGDGGVLESQNGEKTVHCALNGDPAPRDLPVDEGPYGSYLEDFLNDMAGNLSACDLTTAGVLHSMRQTLIVQQAADSGQVHVAM